MREAVECIKSRIISLGRKVDHYNDVISNSKSEIEQAEDLLAKVLYEIDQLNEALEKLNS
jgi:peptidoglycan hydrolase CwlO-like protein